MFEPRAIQRLVARRLPAPSKLLDGVRPQSLLGRRGCSRRERQRLALGLCFIAPALLTFVATFAYPLAYNLWLSLQYYNLAELYQGTHFVGLENYFTALGDPYFWNALRNSALVTVGCLALELPIGMAFALLLNRRVRGHGVFRFILILPLLLIPSVTAYMWRFIFQYEGVVNYMLKLVGASPVNWATTTAGLVSIVIAVVWQNAAFSFIIFLAGLQSIDPEYWGAAKVDGAGAIQRFVYITLPLMRPFILVVLVIRSMDLLRLFDEGYILTGGAPARATETLSQLVYTDTFALFDIGQGSAITILEGIIVSGAVFLIFVTPGLRHKD